MVIVARWGYRREQKMNRACASSPWRSTTAAISSRHSTRLRLFLPPRPAARKATALEAGKTPQTPRRMRRNLSRTCVRGSRSVSFAFPLQRCVHSE